MGRRLIRFIVGLICFVGIVPLFVTHFFLWVATGKSLLESMANYVVSGEQFKFK